MDKSREKYISDLENKLRDQDELYYNAYLKLKQWSESIWGGDQIVHTQINHGIDHSRSILYYAGKLSETISGHPLNPKELFLLLSAAYLHDIGMQTGWQDHLGIPGTYKELTTENFDTIRKSHALTSGKIIRGFKDSVPNQDDMSKKVIDTIREAAPVLAFICENHNTRDIKQFLDKQNPFKERIERVDLLTALLQFSDAMDMTYARIKTVRFTPDMDRIEAGQTPEMGYTDLEWLRFFRCYFVNETDIIKKGSVFHITVTTEFNPEESKELEEKFKTVYFKRLAPGQYDCTKVLNEYGLDFVSNAPFIPQPGNPSKKKIPKSLYHLFDPDKPAKTPKDKTPEQKVTPRIASFTPPVPYFTGRIAELADFDQKRQEKTIICIRGIGGTGKTQFARKCLDTYYKEAACVWYDCGSDTTIDMLIHGAGYPETIQGDKKSQREKYLGFYDLIQRDKKVIILEDYHTIRNREDFDAFLTYCGEKETGEARVLVLSREKLPFSITYEDIKLEGIKEILEYGKWFVQERIGEAINEAELIQINEQVKGHPLAFRFALQLVYNYGHSPDNILKKVANTPLKGEDDLSTCLLGQLMEEAEHKEAITLLREFSLVRDGIDRKGFETIWTNSEPELQNLIDMMFITFERPLFTTHPVIRELALTGLEEGHKKEVCGQLADYFIVQRTDIIDIELEKDIFHYLAEAGRQKEIIERILDAGESFIDRGFITFLTENLDTLKKVGETRAEFDYFYGLALYLQGEWDKAKEKFNKTYIAETGDIKIKLDARIKYGEIIYKKGNTQEAFELWEKITEQAEEKKCPRQQALAFNNLGCTYQLWGKMEKAEELYQKAYNLYIQLGDKKGVASSLNNIATIYKEQGKITETLENFQKSLKIQTELGNKSGIATSLNNIGGIYDAQGKYKEALENYQKSLNIREEIGDKKGIATSLNNIGLVYNAQGKYKDALENYHKSLKILIEIGDNSNIAFSLNNIGSIYDDQGKYKEALENYQTSLKIKEEIGDKSGIANSYYNLGFFMLQNKNRKEGVIYLEKSLALLKELDMPHRVDQLFDYLLSLIKSNPGLLANIIHIEENRLLVEFLQKLVFAYQLSRTAEKKEEVALLAKSLGKEAFPLLFKKLPLNLQNDFTPDFFLGVPEVKSSAQVGRNDPCPCGSGKKYKKCCGK